jgi:hypothetical protein
MWLAYFSIDPVNVAWAQELQGSTLCIREPRDPAPDDSADAVIYDLDSLPATLRKTYLSVLLAGSPAAPTAVHSYNLEEPDVEQLTANGVLVSRCLNADLFRELRLVAAEAEMRRYPARQRVPAARYSFASAGEMG